MNISKIELTGLFLACKDAGALTNDFARVAMEIANGFLLRKAPTLQECEREDIVGDFTVRLVNGWQSIDPERNVFSYLTQMCSFTASDYFRKRQRVETRLDSVDAMEQHQIDALESGYLASEETRESAQVVPGCGCDVLVNPRDGQQAIIFEGE
jgi:DNA-directed RNA polymerase specialized sigma24 family protein